MLQKQRLDDDRTYEPAACSHQRKQTVSQARQTGFALMKPTARYRFPAITTDSKLGLLCPRPEREKMKVSPNISAVAN